MAKNSNTGSVPANPSEQPRVKLQNKFVIYPGSNFIKNILKKLEEVKFALLLSTGLTDENKEEVTLKLQEIEEVVTNGEEE